MRARREISRSGLLAMAGLTAVIGIAVVWRIFAAGSPLGFEAENGVLANGAEDFEGFKHSHIVGYQRSRASEAPRTIVPRRRTLRRGIVMLISVRLGETFGDTRAMLRCDGCAVFRRGRSYEIR